MDNLLFSFERERVMCVHVMKVHMCGSQRATLSIIPGYHSPFELEFLVGPELPICARLGYPESSSHPRAFLSLPSTAITKMSHHAHLFHLVFYLFISLFCGGGGFVLCGLVETGLSLQQGLYWLDYLPNLAFLFLIHSKWDPTVYGDHPTKSWKILGAAKG